MNFVNRKRLAPCLPLSSFRKPGSIAKLVVDSKTIDEVSGGTSIMKA